MLIEKTKENKQQEEIIMTQQQIINHVMLD